MTKNVSLCFVIVAMFLLTSNALVFRPQAAQSHMKEFQSHKAYHLIHQRFSKLFHLQENYDEEGGPIGDFFDWMMNDEEIFESIKTRTELSDSAEQRMKTYLTEHPDVIDAFMVLGNTQESTTKCLEKLSTDQKKKFYGWILQDLDFKSMFTEDAQPPVVQNDQIDEVTQKAMNDPDLGPVFKTCSAKTKPTK